VGAGRDRTGQLHPAIWDVLGFCVQVLLYSRDKTMRCFVVCLPRTRARHTFPNRCPFPVGWCVDFPVLDMGSIRGAGPLNSLQGRMR